MSYLKSSYNVCVLEVPEDFKLAVYDIHQKMLENTFVELLPSQEFGHGWVAINDIFKTDFTAENITVGDCVFGGYRFDKKVVPQILVKKLFKEKLKERKALGEKLSKKDKANLKEECKSQLIMKILPKPNLITWIWDLDNSKVYLDSKSTKVIESFVDLFTRSFEIVDLNTEGIFNSELMNGFLEWLWENLGKRDDVNVNDDITLDTGEKTFFKFNGPNLENYLAEIDSIKNSKSFKKFNTSIIIENDTYKISFNSKDTIVSVKLDKKIKHESAETAVLDNLDRIKVVLDKIKNLMQEHLSKGV